MKFSLKLHFPFHTFGKYDMKKPMLNTQKSYEFSLKRNFENSNMNRKLNICNLTVKNELLNYISHWTISSVDRDPPWINKNIKQLILEKNQAYKSHLRGKKLFQIFVKFRFVQTEESNSLIEEWNEKYCVLLSKKLLDPQTSPKSYWSILKKLLTCKKVPCILSLSHQNKFIIGFKGKAEMFNNYFVFYTKERNWASRGI